MLEFAPEEAKGRRVGEAEMVTDCGRITEGDQR